ncbi:hypothetical protein [Bartonella mastomydis]|nr:hypothetical protein [Bartonella mastomydis]
MKMQEHYSPLQQDQNLHTSLRNLLTPAMEPQIITQFSSGEILNKPVA